MPQFRDPNEKRDFMLNTPIPRLVPKMALPSIAGMLVTSAYNLADTLFVSQLGTDATGAVGVNGSIDLIIMMAGSLLAVGAASLTSRLLGAKQDERAREVLSTCFFLALALGTLVLILGFTYQNKILLLLGANEEILPYSEQYCRYILLAAPFMATSFVLNQCLRAEGSAVFSMIGMVAGAVLNVGLGLFNLIPIPPLDGSKVLAMFLPNSAYGQLMRYERYGILVLLALSWLGLGGNFLGNAIYGVYEALVHIFFA